MAICRISIRAIHWRSQRKQDTCGVSSPGSGEDDAGYYRKLLEKAWGEAVCMFM